MTLSAVQDPDSAQPARPVLGARVAGSDILAIALAIAVVLGLQLQLVFTRSVNWDEFYFLGQVHKFVRGELTVPLQTLHVRLFAWLPGTGSDTVSQIVLGRLVMFAAQIGTCLAIVTIARRFTDLAGAMLCALAYLTFAFVIQHGFAFRTDPLAACMTMAALAILARARLGLPAILVAGVILGAAFMVTIKIVLYAPAFAGIAWLRWSETGFDRRTAAAIAAIPALAIGVAAVLFQLHSLSLAPPDTAVEIISSSGSKMFGLNPKYGYTLKALLLSLPWIVLLAGLARALTARGTPDAAARIALAGLAAPLLTLIFYTNTFPYFYPFILPPVAAALGGGIAWLTGRYRIAVLAGLMALGGVLVWAIDGPSRQQQQRAIEQAVDQIFPRKVAYFDFPGFLPRHQKVNFFMTVWGFRNYIEAGEPHFAAIMQSRPVPLLLAVEPEDNPGLLAVMEGGPNTKLFHAEDLAALRETYRHAWGPIYIAGRRLAPSQRQVWTVHVPGTYTVEGSLRVNGREYRSGDLVPLPRGKAELVAGSQAPAGLVWGERPSIPTHRPPERPYWTGF